VPAGPTDTSEDEILRNTSPKEREDGSVYLETSYNSKILWQDQNLTKDGTHLHERSFIVQRALTYLKHDMVKFKTYKIKNLLTYRNSPTNLLYN
jgi:hypothetical protein